jgi:hypothetical protein
MFLVRGSNVHWAVRCIVWDCRRGILGGRKTNSQEEDNAADSLAIWVHIKKGREVRSRIPFV